MLKKIVYPFLISFLTPLVFFSLHIFRSIDDNRLTSWQWVFNGVDVVKFFFLLVPGVILAFLFSKTSFPRRRAVFLFLTSFIAGALFWKVPEVIVDASRYFTQAKHLEVYGIGYFFREWGKDIMSWTDLPLVPFLYGMIFKCFGESRIFVQTVTTFLFSMTVVLTYLIGRELWEEETGFYGGLLLLAIPYLFIQAPLMLVDVPAMFFLTLAIFLFLRSLASNGLWAPVFSSLALFLAFFSKYSVWAMLSLFVIIGFVYCIQGLKPHTKDCIFRCLMVALLSGILIGIVIFLKRDIFSGQIGLLLEYQKPGLGRWGESFISTFFFQIHPFITVSAVYSSWVALRKRDAKYLIICWLLILALLFQVRRIRYLLPLFPTIALMASYGLHQIRDEKIRKLFVSCAVASSLIISLFAYLPFTQKLSAVNLKNAGEFLDSLEGETVEVFTLLPEDPVVNPAVSVPILDLYTRKVIFYRANTIFSNPDMVQKSPLRFTWEYKNPDYYSTNDPRRKDLVAVIADKPDGRFPENVREEIKGFRKSKVFDISEDIFSYRTIVTIYYN